MALKIWQLTQLTIASIGAFLAYFIGDSDIFVVLLIVFMVIDYLSGVTLAFKERTISSEIGFYSIVKKVFILAMIGIANLLDKALVGTGDILKNAIVFFYLANEGLSILENLSALGLPLPDNLKETLQYLRYKNKNRGVAVNVIYTESEKGDL